MSGGKEGGGWTRATGDDIEIGDNILELLGMDMTSFDADSIKFGFLMPFFLSSLDKHLFFIYLFFFSWSFSLDYVLNNDFLISGEG